MHGFMVAGWGQFSWQGCGLRLGYIWKGRCIWNWILTPRFSWALFALCPEILRSLLPHTYTFSRRDMCALIPTDSDLVLFFRGLPSGYCGHLKVKIKELDVQGPLWLLVRTDCESSLASKVPCRITLNLLHGSWSACPSFIPLSPTFPN